MLSNIGTLGFDAIYVINLPTRLDRREQIAHTLQGFTYTIIDAINGYKDVNVTNLLQSKTLAETFKDPNGIVTLGVIGCALSHIKAWTTFLLSNHSTAVFLEDDIQFNRHPYFDPTYETIIKELQTIQWDIFYLGKKSLKVNGDSITEHICKPHFGKSKWGAHSYALTRKEAERLTKDYIPINLPVDIFLEYSKNMYSVKESLLNQASDGVDWGNQDSDTFKNPMYDAERRIGKNLYVEPFVKSIEFPESGSDFCNIHLKTN